MIYCCILLFADVLCNMVRVLLSASLASRCRPSDLALTAELHDITLHKCMILPTDQAQLLCHRVDSFSESPRPCTAAFGLRLGRLAAR